jgi:hypothetical protein
MTSYERLKNIAQKTCSNVEIELTKDGVLITAFGGGRFKRTMIPWSMLEQSVVDPLPKTLEDCQRGVALR